MRGIKIPKIQLADWYQGRHHQDTLVLVLVCSCLSWSDIVLVSIGLISNVITAEIIGTKASW